MIHGLQLPNPTTWAVRRQRLSLFIGPDSYVLDLGTGERLDEPANPKHYVGKRAVSSEPGRPYFVGGEWRL